MNDNFLPFKIALYLIIAGALVGTVLILVVCCSVVSCAQKRRARKAFSSSNVAIHEKYMDTARSISTNRLVTAGGGSHGSQYDTSDTQIAVGSLDKSKTFSDATLLIL